MRRIMHSTSVRGSFAALLLTMLGCGGSDDAGPTMVPVTTCGSAMTPCGGDVVGSWSLTEACTEGSLTDLWNQQTSADYPSCADSFSNVTMSVNGTVTYDGTNFTRTGSVVTTGKMKITSACLAERLQGLPLSAVSCENLAMVLPGIYPGTTFTCAYDGTNCNCNMNSTQPLEPGGTYTVSGTTITESAGPYSYCVNGSRMSQSVTFVPSGISGIVQLTKK